jgi:hypothetical protein
MSKMSVVRQYEDNEKTALGSHPKNFSSSGCLININYGVFVNSVFDIVYLPEINYLKRN